VHKRRLMICALLAISVAGCTSWSEYVHNRFKVGPEYCRPAAPVAQRWIDADDVRVRSESSDDSQWWTVFNDPLLTDLIQVAYQQNLTVREAGYRVLESRAELGVATGYLFPQVQELDADFNRKIVSTAVANRVATPEKSFSQWDFGFGLSWELDFWGRFRRAIEAGEEGLDASVENYDDVLVTLIGDVATNYVQLRTLQQQLAYVRTNVELQRETLGIARARFDGQMTTELDPDQAESALAQTEAQIPQLEIQIRQTCHRLCVLLGMPPEDLQTRLNGGTIPSAPSEVAVGIPADLLRRRPDVRRQERLAAAQCAQIGIAEADFYPAISIDGTIGYSAEYLPKLATAAAFDGGIGPAFRWKILNYGRIVNNVRAQKARFQQAVANYQNTVLKANAEAENGLVQFLRSQQRAESMAVSVSAAEKAVKVAVAQYKGGLVDFNRVALLEQNLVQQQDLLAQSRGEIAEGLINLYKALGGGWQIRTASASDAVLPPAGSATSVAPSPGDLLPQTHPDGLKEPSPKDVAHSAGS
jgi:NodT family efflux transporter outer membrane factor (OMF) lipoprotein